MKAVDWNVMPDNDGDNDDDNDSVQGSDHSMEETDKPSKMVELITPKAKMEEFVSIHAKEGQLIIINVNEQLKMEPNGVKKYLNTIQTRQSKSKKDFVDKIPSVSKGMFISNKDSVAKSQDTIKEFMGNTALQSKICVQLFQKEQLKSAKSHPEAITLSNEVKQQMKTTVQSLKNSNKTPPDDKLKLLHKKVLPFLPKYLWWQILEVTNECVGEIENSLDGQYSNMINAFNKNVQSQQYVNKMEEVRKKIVKDEIKYMESYLADMNAVVHQQVKFHLDKISKDIKNQYVTILNAKYDD